MKRPEPLLFSLQELVLEVASINRSIFFAGTERKENDIEHSFSVLMLCWYIYTKNNLTLDLAKIFKYAAAHDFVERYAGDTNTYASPEARQEKAIREREALEKLSHEFKDFGDLVTIMTDYENKADDESVFVWTVDKMQAMIMGELDNWRPYSEIKVSYDTFLKKYEEHLANGSSYCREIFETLTDYFKTTYYDRPK